MLLINRYQQWFRCKSDDGLNVGKKGWGGNAKARSVTLEITTIGGIVRVLQKYYFFIY